MAAINGQAMWQVAGLPAAARTYASSAADGMPPAANAEAAPLTLTIACGSDPDAAPDVAEGAVRAPSWRVAAEVAADADSMLGPTLAASTGASAGGDGEAGPIGGGPSARGIATKAAAVSPATAHRQNVCRCPDPLIASATVPLTGRDRLDESCSTRGHRASRSFARRGPAFP
jgi:hypothetical protein